MNQNSSRRRHPYSVDARGRRWFHVYVVNAMDNVPDAVTDPGAKTYDQRSFDSTFHWKASLATGVASHYQITSSHCRQCSFFDTGGSDRRSAFRIDYANVASLCEIDDPEQAVASANTMWVRLATASN